eukprot:COSAG01_NODE_887_length_12898_cov_4.702395_2_plen_78_part_00
MPRLLGRGPCSTRVAYRGVLSPDSAMLLPQRCQVVPGTQSAKNDSHATSNTMDAPVVRLRLLKAQIGHALLHNISNS